MCTGLLAVGTQDAWSSATAHIEPWKRACPCAIPAYAALAIKGPGTPVLQFALRGSLKLQIDQLQIGSLQMASVQKMAERVISLNLRNQRNQDIVVHGVSLEYLVEVLNQSIAAKNFFVADRLPQTSHFSHHQ